MQLTATDRSVMVFRNDREYNGNTFATYAIGVSSKDKDGEWVNSSIDVMFKKGIDLENKTKIFIKNAFPVVSKGKDRNFVKWMITDFEIEGQQTNFMDIPDTIENEIPWK